MFPWAGSWQGRQLRPTAGLSLSHAWGRQQARPLGRAVLWQWGCSPQVTPAGCPAQCHHQGHQQGLSPSASADGDTDVTLLPLPLWWFWVSSVQPLAGPGWHRGCGCRGSCSLLCRAHGDEARLELGGIQHATASGIFMADLC